MPPERSPEPDCEHEQRKANRGQCGKQRTGPALGVSAAVCGKGQVGETLHDRHGRTAGLKET